LYEIRFTKIGFLLSFTAFSFLQRLSAFSNGFLIFFNSFLLSPMAFRISPTAFRFSSTAFRFPRYPRKSIYGEKYRLGVARPFLMLEAFFLTLP
jgi:hypothetical protein